VSKDRTNDIEEAASEWLIRRDSGQWTQADKARFELWLEASTLNRVTFLRLELAWEESARLKALGAGVAGDLPPPPGRWNLDSLFFRHRTTGPDGTAGRKLPTESIRRGRRLATAASVMIAVAVGFGAFRFGAESGERFTTPIGGLAKVPMLDGSKITLNTSSELRVALTTAERRIHLQEGEAFFEVAHDSKRPFVVEAGGKRVIAVGTKFSVRRNGESIEVIVTEGKVRMEDAGEPLRSAAVEASGSAMPQNAAGPVFLLAGESALSNEAGLSVHRGTLEEAETRLSWRDGVLSFRDLPLADAVAEFNRYNVRKITIADPGVAAMRVEGNFRPTNVEAFVRLLENGFPIRASVDDDRIVLGSR
jgi:transmembrane sensor